jgi:hypothetical protein
MVWVQLVLLVTWNGTSNLVVKRHAYYVISCPIYLVGWWTFYCYEMFMLLIVDHEDKCKNLRKNILDW